MTLTDQGKFQTAQGGSVALTATSSAYTPTAGSIQVALINENARNDGASADAIITFSDTWGDTGGGAWTAQVVAERGAIGTAGYTGHAEIWTRLIGTGPSSGTVTGQATINGSTSSSDGWLWIDVVEVTGQSGSPIGQSTGATGLIASGSSTYTQTLGGAPASTSIVFSIAADFDTGTNGAPTKPTGFTLLQSDTPTGVAACATAYINTGATTSFSWTIPSTDQRLGSALEIVMASTGLDVPLLRPIPQPAIYRM